MNSNQIIYLPAWPGLPGMQTTVDKSDILSSDLKSVWVWLSPNKLVEEIKSDL